MATMAPYVIGTEVSCTDGVCGRLSRVVIDPVGPQLTHLVVEPAHHPDRARLVPIDLVDQDADGIRLHCDTAHFELLEDAQETEILPAAADQFAYEADHGASLPYFPLGVAGRGALGPAADVPKPRTVTYDRVPAGEVDVRRGQPVHATDGEIGRVRGLVVDPRDHQVTHVLLDEGHLWGKKQVALPIGNVTDVRQGVQLDLSKDEVRNLPPVDLEQPGQS
jgi:hypothetical protein